MLFAISNLLFLLLCVAATAQCKPDQGQDGVAAKLRCGAVNFMVTAFLPQAHATAFCSAYLQIPVQTQISTATVTAKASIITETRSKVVPTLTRTASTILKSTTTTTIDLWSGKPACSTVPSFDWIRESREAGTLNVAVLEQACRCLDIPESTSTVMAVATTTPTLTVTEGVTGLTVITSTRTQLAVETQAKFIYLIDRTKDDAIEHRQDGTRALSIIDRALGLELAQSIRNNLSDTTDLLRHSIQPLDTANFEAKLNLLQVS